MNIALLEPLSVPDKIVAELSAPLVEAGHSFKAFPTRTTDPNELRERAEGADVVIIANTPFPASVIGALPKLKLVDVAFTGVSYDRRLLEPPSAYGGSWLLASRLLSYDYLWNEVRVKGGAYGCGFSTARPGSMGFYSFRDPRVDETVARIGDAGA